METSDETCDETSWEPITVSSYHKDDMVALLVGPDEIELHAHGAYLCRQSDFFEAALKEEWIEGQTRIVKLPREQPETVAQYLDFIYTGCLPTTTMKTIRGRGRAYNVLAELFALGERLLDSELRNVVISEFVRVTTYNKNGTLGRFPDNNAVRTIYRCTTSASPARRLIVNFYTSADPKCVTDKAPSAFARDLARASLSRLRSSDQPRAKIEASDYFV